MTVKTYLIADIRVHSSGNFAEYMKRMPDFVKKYGGRYLVKGNNPITIEGDWRPDKLVVIEFPSNKNINQFIKDPDVQKLFVIRHQSSTSQLIVVDGCE